MTKIDTKAMTNLDERLRTLIEMGRGMLLRGEGLEGYLVDLRTPQLVHIDEIGKFLGPLEKSETQISEICEIEQNFAPRDYFDSVFSLIRGAI